MTVPVDTVLNNDAFDHQAIRSQFPILDQKFDDNPLCYLDTAATSQKPTRVINAMMEYYQQDNANVHRAAHQLSARATINYEHVRSQVQQFINAAQTEEVIFTHGTTESINMVAAGLTEQLKPEDIILVDSAAHHANLVPWQQLAKKTGAIVKAIPLNQQLSIDITAYDALLALKPKLVAISHVTNAVGSVNDVCQLVEMANKSGALTLVDGAQAVAHIEVDVQQINCDFYVFSAHKMYGPTGVGILYGRYVELDKLEPLLTGGEMIKSVSFEATTFGSLPNKLEAGTPAISAVIGLGAAINFINELPKTALIAYEQNLLVYLQKELQNLGDIELIGASKHNIGVVAFNLAQEHHQDVGILLDQQGIAVRCGHHCAMPLMQILNIKGCCRASLGVYTNKQDIDLFIKALRSVKELLL
ncbi:cysteine desulfurase [Shewanella donghaensis]|uniref:cysteine desulfurase n=1 Tax=Shewanella donghaensis TaxID=238836 RepID=UPI00118247B9|nr:cysteine desulfurase [Shewanella donghaensis]